MKKIALIIPILSIYTYANNNIINEIGKKLEMIKYEDARKSEDIESINYDPFHPQNKKETTIIKKDGKKIVVKTKNEEKLPNLSMIFNKKAFIDGKWYKENSKVADYVLKRINEDNVILKKKNKLITIRLNSKKNIFFKRGTR